MKLGERAGRRAIVAATGAVLAGVLTADNGSGAGAAHAADRTFNVSLVGHLNPLTSGLGTTNNIYADLWADDNLVVLGSVDTGRGVTIINNANPAMPTMASRYEPAGSANGQFRDVLVRDGIGYFAIDTPTTSIGGVHLVNLANPASPSKLSEINVAQNGFQLNHDLFLDGDFLYIASNRTSTIKVFNVANPAAPTFVRNVVTTGATTEDLHDMTVKSGRMYTSNITTGLMEIFDVTDIASPSWSTATRKLGQINPGVRNHSSWPSEDGNLLAIAREQSDGEVQLWDISNLGAPVLKSSIFRTPFGIDSFSAHNPVIIGDTLYVSWYQAGLQIFNIRNPSAPVHLGAYDTFVGGVGSPGSFLNYDGNWGLYPFFGPDKILLSDFDNGFFNVDATAAFRRVWTYEGGPLWWQDATRWNNGVGGFPDSSEMIAAFTNPAAGASRTVWVEGGAFVTPKVPRVAGIEFLSSLSYTLQPNTGGEIELIASQGLAKITVIDNGPMVHGSNRILAPIQLNDDLLVTNNAHPSIARALELNTIKATDRQITFAGSGETSLVAANPLFTGDIAVVGGRLALGHGQATNSQPIAVNGGVLILRNNASTHFGSDLSFSAGNSFLAVANDGTGLGQTHSVGDLTVAGGASLSLTRNNGARLAAGDVSIGGSMTVTSQPNGPGATRFETLAISPGGKLNLTNAPLIVASTPVAAVESLVRSGHNGGAWNGSGIITTQADALAGLTTLAVATADQTGHASFGGMSVGGDDVLVMYTYAGDANLDGQITGDDYSSIDFNIAIAGASGYFNGDFNYDGAITGDDYSVIDFNIVAQGVPFAVSGATQALSLVPEPAALTALLAASPLLARRRRRARED